MKGEVPTHIDAEEVCIDNGFTHKGLALMVRAGTVPDAVARR